MPRSWRMDLAAVRAAPGVVAVVTAAGHSGRERRRSGVSRRPAVRRRHGRSTSASRCSPSPPTTVEQARRAARLAAGRVRATCRRSSPSRTRSRRAVVRAADRTSCARGDREAALAAAPHASRADRIGGQEHFYLEGQIAFAVPSEDGDMLVYSSTQHPSEVQHLVAHVLGLARTTRSTVEVPAHGRRLRRQGDARRRRSPAWPRCSRSTTGARSSCGSTATTTCCMTGKRHDFLDRVRRRLRRRRPHPRRRRSMLAARCGYSADLSAAINDRAMFHADNAYFLPQRAASSRTAARPTPCPTPPSAASAGRRA